MLAAVPRSAKQKHMGNPLPASTKEAVLLINIFTGLNKYAEGC